MAANAGWYPQEDGTQRYWDGTQWTNNVAPGASPGRPPSVGGPASGASKLRWLKTRTAIGVGSGLLGLIIGVSGSSDGGENATKTESLSAKISTLRDQNADLQKAADEAARVATANDDAVNQKVTEAIQQTRQEAAAAQKQAVAAAVAKAVAKERAKADARVAQAKKDAAEEASSQQSDNLAGGSSGGTDPRFRTCSDANDAGYGPYTEGVDPEYDWYIDRDGDGVVCEP